MTSYRAGLTWSWDPHLQRQVAHLQSSSRESEWLEKHKEVGTRGKPAPPFLTRLHLQLTYDFSRNQICRPFPPRPTTTPKLLSPSQARATSSHQAAWPKTRRQSIEVDLESNGGRRRLNITVNSGTCTAHRGCPSPPEPHLPPMPPAT